MSSVLSEMQKIITEFKNEIPDYIDKIFTEKLSPGTQSYDQEGSLLPKIVNLTQMYIMYLSNLKKLVQGSQIPYITLIGK